MSVEDEADELIQDSRREERRVRLTLEALRGGGPPVRVRDVANVAGISKTKVMQDGRAGEVVIRWVKCGTRKMGVVERHEAYRYLVHIGIAS